VRQNQIYSIAIFLLISILAILPVAAEPQLKTLGNGMTVFLNPIESEENVAILLAYHAGADAQTAQTAGLFKLLELALFNGPAASPGTTEPAAAIDVLEPNRIAGGASLDRFEFGFSVSKEKLVPALDTILYLFSQERREFLLAQEDGVENARQSARALVKDSTLDSNAIHDMAIAKKLFSRAPFRLDVLGADYVLEKADAATLRTFAATWLVPNNAFIAIAGNFDTDQIMNLLDERFGQLPKASNPWSVPLAAFPKPGVTRPLFLVFPDSTMPSGMMQVELRYRGPDPKETSSFAALRMLEELANTPSSRFFTAIRKGMPKGAEPKEVRIAYSPNRNASWLSIIASIPLPSGKKPTDIVFSFKELARGTELYMIKSNPAYFSAAEYQSARQALLEKTMAIQGDPLDAAAHAAALWSWGIPSFVFQESDAIMKTGQKELSQAIDTYVQKNLEVVTVRLNPDLYEANKKIFSSNGFETVTAQNAFWWR
jgi:zinc protease